MTSLSRVLPPAKSTLVEGCRPPTVLPPANRFSNLLIQTRSWRRLSPATFPPPPAPSPSPSDPNEKLEKTFACYLSTTTVAVAVAGTIYLSTARVAFCSDRRLCFTAPSGQETWSYYKVVIPLENIGTVNQMTMRENPSDRYIQIITVDGHDLS